LRFIVLAVMGFLWMAQAPGYAAGSAADVREPDAVIESYLRAIYARDYTAAYNFISAEDRKLRDLDRYLRQRGPYNGFALEAARKLSDYIEVRFLKAQESDGRKQITIRYRVPDPQKVAPLVLQWEPRRLNSLSPADQHQLIETLDRRGRDGALTMSEGEENFEVVQESGTWRIFLNWAAGIAIPLKVDVSKASELEVALSKDKFVLQPGDVFDVVLKIRNRAKEPVTLRIGHLVEPRPIADYVDFVQCGFLLPVTVPAEKEQEFAGTYLLRDSLPEGVRHLSLTYEFRRLQ
jgi:hypothetical protein